jgi:hypothetical protein
LVGGRVPSVERPAGRAATRARLPMLFDTKAPATCQPPGLTRRPGNIPGHDIFRPPAFASRSSDSRRGIGPSSRSAYRPTTGPRRGYRVPHARAATGVGALYTPETAVLLPTDRGCRPAPAASQRPVPVSRNLPTGEISSNEASTRVQAIRPSGLPQPVAARVERAALGLKPRASHPADQEPTTHAEAGTGHRARSLELPLNSHPSISNPIVHSMRATSRRTPRSGSSAPSRPRDRRRDQAQVRVGG